MERIIHISDRVNNQAVILGNENDSSPNLYFTRLAVYDPTGHFNQYYGHYCLTLNEAEIDFADRYAIIMKLK